MNTNTTRSFVAHYCARGFDNHRDCDSNLCRERGCHTPRVVTTNQQPRMERQKRCEIKVNRT